MGVNLIKPKNEVKKGDRILLDILYAGKSETIETKAETNIDLNKIKAVVFYGPEGSRLGYIRTPPIQDGDIMDLSSMIGMLWGHVSEYIESISFPGCEVNYVREDIFNDNRRSMPIPFRPGC